MDFINYFYIIILLKAILIQKAWNIDGSADFNAVELEHLSKKLHPTECMKLLDSIYLRTPAYVVKDGKNENLPTIQPTQGDCLSKLEQWNRAFPGNEDKKGREYMENCLKQIGRSDLSNFVKRNKRLIDLMSNFIWPGDSYLYNKYLPRRFSKRFLTQLNIEKAANDNYDDINNNNNNNNDGSDGDINKINKGSSKKRQLDEGHIKTSESSMKKHSGANVQAEKELTNLKRVKTKAATMGQNKYQSRQAPATNGAKLSRPNGGGGPEIHWILLTAVLIGIIGIFIVFLMIYIYKSGNRLRDILMSRGRCDPRCKGYERFPKDAECACFTSSTEVTPRKWQSSTSLPLSCPSTPENKLKSQKKLKSIADDKKKLEKELLKLAEKDKKKRDKRSCTEKTCPAFIDNIVDDMKMNFAGDIAHILRKDKAQCSCCPCSATKAGDRVCGDECCPQRRIKDIASLCATRPCKAATKKSGVTKRRTSKIHMSKMKSNHRRASSTDTLLKDRRDLSKVSPRTCVRESTFDSPRKRDSYKEKSSSKKDKSPSKCSTKSPRRMSMEPCNNETCGMRLT